ncbi:unnamed protein product [Amoebophrya sp. A120]|nr:unnamed protein product [Amoebophrya sp. A120]|eukprot:GSA120T00001981001.1
MMASIQQPPPSSSLSFLSGSPRRRRLRILRLNGDTLFEGDLFDWKDATTFGAVAEQPASGRRNIAEDVGQIVHNDLARRKLLKQVNVLPSQVSRSASRTGSRRNSDDDAALLGAAGSNGTAGGSNALSPSAVLSGAADKLAGTKRKSSSRSPDRRNIAGRPPSGTKATTEATTEVGISQDDGSWLLAGSSLGQACKCMLDEVNGDNVPLRCIMLMDTEEHRFIDDDEDVDFNLELIRETSSILEEPPDVGVVPASEQGEDNHSDIPRQWSDDFNTLSRQHSVSISRQVSRAYSRDSGGFVTREVSRAYSRDSGPFKKVQEMQLVSRHIEGYCLSPMLQEMLDGQYEVAHTALFDNDFEFGGERKTYAREEWALSLYQTEDRDFEALSTSDPKISTAVFDGKNTEEKQKFLDRAAEQYMLRRRVHQVLDELQKVLTDQNFFSRGMVHFLDFAWALVKSRHFPVFEKRTRRFSKFLCDFARINHPRFRNLRGLIELTHMRLRQVYGELTPLSFYKLLPNAWHGSSDDVGDNFHSINNHQWAGGAAATSGQHPHLNEQADYFINDFTSPRRLMQVRENQREGCRLVAARLCRLLPPTTAANSAVEKFTSTARDRINFPFDDPRDDTRASPLPPVHQLQPSAGMMSMAGGAAGGGALHLSVDAHINEDILRLLAQTAEQEEARTKFFGDEVEVRDSEGNLKVGYRFDPVQLAQAGHPAVVQDVAVAQKLCELGLAAEQNCFAEVLSSLLRGRSYQDDDGANAIRVLRQLFGSGDRVALTDELRNALFAVVKRDINRIDQQERTSNGRGSWSASDAEKGLSQFVSPEFARLARMRTYSGSAVEDHLSLVDVEHLLTCEWGGWSSSDPQREWRKGILESALGLVQQSESLQRGVGVHQSSGTATVSPVRSSGTSSDSNGNRGQREQPRSRAAALSAVDETAGVLNTRTLGAEVLAERCADYLRFRLEKVPDLNCALAACARQNPAGADNKEVRPLSGPILVRRGECIDLLPRVLLFAAALIARDSYHFTSDLTATDGLSCPEPFRAGNVVRLLHRHIAEFDRQSAVSNPTTASVVSSSFQDDNGPEQTSEAHRSVVVCLAFAMTLLLLERGSSSSPLQSTSTSNVAVNVRKRSVSRGDLPPVPEQSSGPGIITADEADVITEYEAEAMAYYEAMLGGGQKERDVLARNSPATLNEKDIYYPAPNCADAPLRSISSMSSSTFENPQLAVMSESLRALFKQCDSSAKENISDLVEEFVLAPLLPRRQEIADYVRSHVRVADN